ncbi:Uncharacterized protein dnl_47640 [Desulfonema limicola]|uniref:Uncharacterized protein n=1 Tax=Desulfonema limicola TaxID=45656 RepID=A0A975BBU6_9BACT|nr:Uncharacterized protein dnl_47640 [Desulfonema limicola]
MNYNLSHGMLDSCASKSSSIEAENLAREKDELHDLQLR